MHAELPSMVLHHAYCMDCLLDHIIDEADCLGST